MSNALFPGKQENLGSSGDIEKHVHSSTHRSIAFAARLSKQLETSILFPHLPINPMPKLL